MRAQPADAKLRVFLFQLLCVLGQWERALNQLKVASELDPLALAMAQIYGDAVRCEAIRTEVFEGKKSPMVLRRARAVAGAADRIPAARRTRRGGDIRRSFALQAFEEAPTSSGTIDDRPFEWIADADSRLGPVMEAIINGRYYWVPFARVSTVTIDAPEDLRDLVWMPAHLQFDNGGESLALIPTRYPGSEASDDGAIALARKTVVGTDRPGRVLRPRPAHHRDRRRRDALSRHSRHRDHARRRSGAGKPGPGPCLTSARPGNGCSQRCSTV